MSGDYTKFTFKSKKDYSAVLKQQGRVDLDADFNELLDIIDRRWRSETIDIIGHCTVPQTPSGTPPEFDPFRIIPTALGAFNIGIGRMYVDGIQVENHGLPRTTPPPPAAEDYLADLGELRGPVPVPYSNQPYLPQPLPPALNIAAGNTDLIYIDVWQREVTVLEDPSLREIALGGPDTTTRIQSAWQVRALQNIGTHGCGDDIPRWNDLIKPSAGRLTTSAVAPPASDDPCIISPSGGYRGLENRLYRVEIHSLGAPAKFKWSRNNATIVSSISAIPSSTEIVVQQIGRDQVLRFRIGDWIEVTDDFREFQEASATGKVGLAGHMARITNIDEANRVIRFSPAIPGTFNFDATNPSRHTRIRRWDQTQNVDANGLLDVIAGPIEIEDGIRVTLTLDPAGGSFNIGDYWVFAARTADGSVELLQNAPPRGILHHFCRLGFIHWGANLAGTSFTDCREHWPPHCCEAGCTVTVGDGIDSEGQFTDIQQAINALGNRGGVVCIGRGVFPVNQTIRLNAIRNTIIRGMGPATRIIFTSSENNSRFMEIVGCEHTRIQGLFVASLDAQALIQLSDSRFCAVEGSLLVNLNLPDPAGGESTPRGRAIEFAGVCVGCDISANQVLAAKGVTVDQGAVQDLQITNNRMLSRLSGVLVGEVTGLEVVHNQLRGIALEAWQNLARTAQALSRDNIDQFQNGVLNAFRDAVSSTEFQAVGVLVFAGRRVLVNDNLICAHFGIVLFLAIDATVAQNEILSLIAVQVFFAALIRISNNLLLGLIIGVSHTGLLADMLCEANTFGGFFGLLTVSLQEWGRLFGALLVRGLNAAGFTQTGALLAARLLNKGAEWTDGLSAFGIAFLLKVHRNVFVSFISGIEKTAAVLSADWSVLDNTFTLCGRAGINLPGNHAEVLQRLLRFSNERHSIQSNALNVIGRGIISSCRQTAISDNHIQCPAVGVDLNGPNSSICNNVLIGTQPELAADTGLIRLREGATDLFISANRLANGPGHGILIVEGLSRLVIADNVIEDMRVNGIATASDLIWVNELDVRGNRIVRCRGDAAPNVFWHGGALVLGGGTRVRVICNRFFDNSPQANLVGAFHVIYAEDLDGAELAGNTVEGNIRSASNSSPLLAGAIFLRLFSGDLRIQSNGVRDNGGPALIIFAASSDKNVVRALIEANHFSGNLERFALVSFVDTSGELHFEGNQSLQELSGESLPLSVFLGAPQAIVNGNTVRRSGQPPSLGVFGAAGPSSRGIITSNLTNGPITASFPIGGLVLANNLML